MASTEADQTREPPTPPVDEERARRYERGSLWLRLLHVALFAGSLLVLLLGGASVSLSHAVRDFTGYALPQLPIYTVVLVTGYALLMLPF